MNEGKATLGVWLPVALSDIYTALLVLIRIQLSHPEKLKIPERSEVMQSWCLPMLSRSVKADEEERKALELYNTVNQIKYKYGKK